MQGWGGNTRESIQLIARLPGFDSLENMMLRCQLIVCSNTQKLFLSAHQNRYVTILYCNSPNEMHLMLTSDMFSIQLEVAVGEPCYL